MIDNSKFFRMNTGIPLVVAEVNPDELNNHKNLISNPNCSTIQLVLTLKPLHDIYKVKRVIVSTYQAVSGAGKSSMDELISQSSDVLNGKNVISKTLVNKLLLMLFLILMNLWKTVTQKRNGKWKMKQKKFWIIISNCPLLV